MTIQVTGVLVDPTNTPLNKADIKITALINTSTLAHASVVKKTGIDGTYDFNLVEGKFKIEINQKNKFNEVAYVEVTNLTTTPTTLYGLIESSAFCEPVSPTCAV